MADYLTTTEELTSIADAIRSKGGTVASLSYPTQFVSAINAIEINPIELTVNDAIVTKIADTADDYLLTMKNGSPQSKTATPSGTEQTVTPDAGYDYLSQVTVAAIPYRETDNTAGGVTVTIGSAT